MTINKYETQRQMPKKKEITSHKFYNDLVYAYFQVNCTVDPETHEKYILTKNINYSAIGRAIGYSRQTVTKKIEKLLELGLLQKKEDRYEILTLENNSAFLISKKTLTTLMVSLTENAINIYIYLLNRYIANQEKEYAFTFNSVKEYIGIATSTRSNNIIVTGCLEVLERLGLIKYEIKYHNNEQTGEISKSYILTYATNKLPEYEC